MLPRPERMRSADMRSFFSEGHAATRRSASNRLLILRYRPNGLRNHRVAVVAGKALGNAATRNRARRRIREAYRRARYETQAGYDLVFVARAPVVAAKFSEIHQSVLTLIQRSQPSGVYHDPSG